ncbi:ParA family protein [Natrialbaceae archaeon GCM10025810]|uniref:ParA family protein n=1 Tax=Halovalidus salilacus TaxID=3075124 RepID=UPI003615D23F
MTVLTIWSESGGVGKTTTALNLAAALGIDGYDVLVVDLDPQPASITDYAGYPEAKTDDAGATIVDALLEDDVALGDIVIEDDLFDLVPGHESLATLENTVRAEQISMAEFLLRSELEPLTDEYEFVIVDPPATLNLLVDNALIASGNVLIPMEMTRKGERSVTGVLETVNALEKQLQRAQPEFELNVVGVLPNRVEGSTMNQEIRSSLEEADEDVDLLPVTIPDYNVLERTWDANLDVFRYAEEHGFRAYQESLLDAFAELAAIIEAEHEDEADHRTQVNT